MLWNLGYKLHYQEKVNASSNISDENPWVPKTVVSGNDKQMFSLKLYKLFKTLEIEYHSVALYF